MKPAFFNKDQRKKFYWGVGLKLILISSSIILVSFATMIYLATYFFREDYELRVQEQNIRLSEVIGTNVELTLTSLMQQGRLLSQSSLQNLGNDEGNDIVFVGSYQGRQIDSVTVARQLVNNTFLKKNNLNIASLTNVISLYKDRFRHSFDGFIGIVNVSSIFPVPMVAISFPEKKSSNNDTTIIILCPMQVFTNSFQSENAGLIQTFMVDMEGRVIAHPDATVVQAEADYSKKLPIVRSMQKSRFRNGQTIYLGEDNENYLGSYWKSYIGTFGIVSTVRGSDAFATVYEIQVRNIYLMIVAISLAILAVYLYGRRLTRPIQALTQTAYQIADGDYNVNVEVQSKDEIGILTSSFNDMGKGLRERENLKASFERFVNKEIVKKSLAGKLQLGGKRYEIALLFSDIRSFTTMSEKMKPEEVVKFLNMYFSEMVNCIAKTKGIVDKFIGDAIMAHWGAVEPHANPAKAAVDAGIAMRNALLKFNMKYRKNDPVRFGIGINFGPAIAGQIGSEQRFEYTVIGDTVNVASRVEGLCKQLGADLLITNNVLRHVKNHYLLEHIGDIQVKGKAKAVDVHAVLGHKNDPNAPRNIKELRKRVGIVHVASRSRKKK